MPASTKPALPSRAALERMLDEAYRGPAWHGPSVQSALRGVDAERALWRPGPGRPNVWEQALHCALGKHIVSERLDPSVRPRFPRPRTNAWWSPSPDVHDAAARAQAWAADLALLDACHERLLATLRRIPRARLDARQGRVTLGEQVAGMVMHDAYHAGQIALVLRLAESTAG